MNHKKFTVSQWSDFKFDRKEIAGEICDRLSKLDTEFADAVADDVSSDSNHKA